jgi:hypothetical protein
MWLWQFATVRFNYDGNWTALFCTAPGWPRPAFLGSENVYTFPGSLGYDGEMYHLIAHDPWMFRGAVSAMDDPELRYRRILVPALAWAIAVGRDSAVHAAYFAVILGFVFLGVYWLARVMVIQGRHAAWGLIFVLMPATLVSMDRMTVDVALAALAVGFVLFCDSKWRVLPILACAALTRETGLLLTVGYGVFLLSRRRFADVIWAAASALPAILWYVYVSGHAPPGPTVRPADVANFIPLGGWIERIAHASVYPLPRLQALVAIELDYVALAGIAFLLVHALRLAWSRRWDARAAAIYVFAAAIVFIGSQSVWQDAFSYGRIVTPLMVLLACEDSLTFVSVGLIDSRIGLNFLRQIIGVGRGLF